MIPVVTIALFLILIAMANAMRVVYLYFQADSCFQQE
jgi:hypothetical protein